MIALGQNLFCLFLLVIILIEETQLVLINNSES